MNYSQSLHLFKINIAMTDDEVTLDYLMSDLWIVGSPADEAAQFRQHYEDAGEFGVYLAMSHEWEPKDRWVKSMTLLIE